ncbi:MAG: hypothetical protein K2N22_05890 [Clostridia bacterium]|nr:hypothetical protein [Clostridia bacterium]
MEENQREEGGTSLKDIFRTIFTQKWLALIILIVVTIAGTVGIYFGMNYFKREYVASFVLNLPGDDGEKNYYVYPDGTTFYFSDLISKQTLKDVKKSDEAFGGIDVEKMADEGDITIIRTQSSEKGEATYTINVKASYFKNIEVARLFIDKIANVPGSHLAEMNIAYDNKISNVDSLKSYENMITAFEDQCEDLMKQYEQFITEYKPDFVIREGKTLQYYLNEIDTYVNKNQTLAVLKTRVQNEGILKSEELKEDYKAELEQVKRDLVRESSILDAMTAGSTDIQQNSIAIRDQAAKVADLTQRQKDLEKYISADAKTADEAFKKAVADAGEAVKGFTADFKYAAETVYSVALTVSFATSNVITKAGETGLVMSVVISLVAGIILALLIGYIVGAVKLSKRQKAAEEVPAVETEAVAQAAVADAEQTDTAEKDEK